MLEGPSYSNRLCVGSTVLQRERGQGQPGVNNGVFPGGEWNFSLPEWDAK